MNSFISDIKKNTYGVYSKHKEKNMKSVKEWLNDGINKKPEKREPEPEPEPEDEKKSFKASTFFLVLTILLVLFIITGIFQVCVFKRTDLIIDDVTVSPFIDYRPFRWGTTGTTWYGQWFGLMQTNSWTWLALLYKKYFIILESIFAVVKDDKNENVGGKIMKGFAKFWVLAGLGFSYWVMILIQSCFGWLLPASQAVLALFLSSPDVKKREDSGMLDRIIGYISYFFTYVPVIFFTWILQLFYFPYLIWSTKKAESKSWSDFFKREEFVWLQDNETKGGIFTSFIGFCFLLLPGIFFFLMGDYTGLITGSVFMLLLLLFSSLSIWKFVQAIKEEAGESLDKIIPDETDNVNIKHNPKTNFPIKGGRKRKTRKQRK